MNEQNKKNLCLKVFYFCKIFFNIENPRIFFYKIREILFSLFFNVHKKNMFPIEIEDGREVS